MKSRHLAALAPGPVLLVALACRSATPADARQTQHPGEANRAEGSAAASVVPVGARRIVAVGDVHGDIASAREALQLAGAVDAEGSWSGGDLIVVQVGDQTDRGDDEREILDWFDRLRDQAAAAGGEFCTLLGNHEIMNVQADLRYVTQGGFADFAEFACPTGHTVCEGAPEPARGRIAAFAPGGPYARLLAEHDIVRVIDGNVFVHGGLLPDYARLGIDSINAVVDSWLRAEGPPPEFLLFENNPLWYRGYSLAPDAATCALLEETLDVLDAERMIVGHTVQDAGITSGCDGRIWRVDVGLADYYGGTTQVLEIVGDEVRVLQ